MPPTLPGSALDAAPLAPYGVRARRDAGWTRKRSRNGAGRRSSRRRSTSFRARATGGRAFATSRLAAGASTGSVYHHFKDKEELFDTLLSEYWTAIESPDFPFNRALASGAFPDRLEELAEAAEASVKTWQRHIALIYVDVVEMQGTHIQRFYSGMADRFAAFLHRNQAQDGPAARLAPEVDPPSAVMLASRIFLQYYAVELLFRVPDQFGKPRRRPSTTSPRSSGEACCVPPSTRPP